MTEENTESCNIDESFPTCEGDISAEPTEAVHDGIVIYNDKYIQQ